MKIMKTETRNEGNSPESCTTGERNTGRMLKRLPVGIQTFSNIIEGDMLYIDKTEYIWNMIQLSKYVFLSRPRRFGKSLLVSTLQAYFEGRRELFKGLYIESVEKEWTEYPVLRFDMSMGKHMEREQLERYLIYILGENEKRFGIISDHPDPNVRMKNLISQVYEKTGKKVVVLIDEYDAPLLDVVHEDTKLPILRNVMRNFYSPLKAADPYLQFVFLTGITKFSQLSIFSELNNLKNISMIPDYAALCGISKEETLTQMSEYIDDFAEHKQLTREETIEKLKQQYDGYHFTASSPDIFNPFSLLNAFQDHELNNYWFASGTPTYLIEMLRKFGTLPTEINSMEGGADDFDAPTEGMNTIMPLLYQSGYVTIKDYNERFRSYTLGMPNNEVRIGLTKALVPAYVMPNTLVVNNTARNIARRLEDDDIDGALRIIQTFLGTVPYCNDTDTEGHYQQVLYIIFTLVSDYFTDVEVRTPTGRVDMVMRTKNNIYIFELKLNRSADSAIDQINEKDYAAKFALANLPIVKVGICFDSEKRTIGEWKIESL